MKKGKIIAGALALFIAAGTAYAFKANTLPGNLYYYNSDLSCVAAPCSTVDQIGYPCLLAPLYTDERCELVYGNIAWETDGGQ